MCGIIGYSGPKKPIPILLDGLSALEYRGYDSAGIALSDKGQIKVIKTKGRIADLREKVGAAGELPCDCGIGHTRWATHGEPSDLNSHPHSAPSLTLVHNGIIENYAEIASRLKEKGYTFLSETDSEVAAKLIDSYYTESKDPVKAIFAATAEMRGSYAFGILFHDLPHTLFAIRKSSPLIVAATDEGSFIASDIPAILPYTRDCIRLDEDILAVLDGGKASFFDRNGDPVTFAPETVTWSAEEAKKDGYPHFMLKEIHEEPTALPKTLSPLLENGLPHFGIDLLDSEKIASIGRIHIVACGTAMHAGLYGKEIFEKYARVPVDVEVASEFRYQKPILAKNDLVLLLSQSGETADTLAALRYAKGEGVRTLAIVNVIGSSVAREADDVLYTRAGPEIAVASTKAYTVQCGLMALIACRFAWAKGKMKEEEVRAFAGTLMTDVPEAIRQTLALAPLLKEVAGHFLDAEHLFFIGRRMDRALAVEASLKLKEISYIHSEAYAAGELKHGTISLITEGTPVVALMTDSELFEKMVSGIREVKARGAHIFAVLTEEHKNDAIPADDLLILPPIQEDFAFYPAATAMQMLAYYVSAGKGLDCDKPRNLAKSVTVE